MIICLWEGKNDYENVLLCMRLKTYNGSAWVEVGIADHSSLSGKNGEVEYQHMTAAEKVVLDNTSGENTGDITVTDSAEITLGLTGQALTASLVDGSIDESKLDAGVNSSLDLADSALQSETDPLSLHLDQTIPQTIINGMPTFGGGLLVSDKLKFTQTDGNEAIDSLNDGYMDYLATTGHRFDRAVTVTGNITGSNLSGTNTGDQDLSVKANLSGADFTGNVSTTGILNIVQQSSGTRGLLISGNGTTLGSPMSDTGLLLSVGYNHPNNCQAWLSSSGHSGSFSQSSFRYILGFPVPIIDGVSNDGSVVRNISFGQPGVNIGVGLPVGTTQAGVTAKLHIRGDGTGTGTALKIINSNGTQRFAILDNGNVSASGTVTGSNLSGTNTGDQDLSKLATKSLSIAMAIALG